MKTLNITKYRPHILKLYGGLKYPDGKLSHGKYFTLGQSSSWKNEKIEEYEDLKVGDKVTLIVPIANSQRSDENKYRYNIYKNGEVKAIVGEGKAAGMGICRGVNIMFEKVEANVPAIEIKQKSLNNKIKKIWQ